jgi:hypothetical protein
VNAADDEIEAAQHVVGIVERAVWKDIDSIPLKMRKRPPNAALRRSISARC